MDIPMRPFSDYSHVRSSEEDQQQSFDVVPLSPVYPGPEGEPAPCIKLFNRVSRTYKVIIVLLTICLCLLFSILLKMFVFYDNLCKTTHCVNAASEMLNALDETVDPCTDFYQFACGGWREEHDLADGYSRFNQINLISDQVTSHLKHILESRDAVLKDDAVDGNKDENSAEMKWNTLNKRMFDLYDSCMDTGRVDEMRARPITSVIDHLSSLFTVSAGKGLWSKYKNSQALAKTLAYLHSVNINALFSIGVGKNVSNPAQRVLYIGQSGLGLDQKTFYTDNSKLVHYEKVIMKSFLYAFNITDDVAANASSNVIQFETALSKIHWDQVDNLNISKTENLYSVKSLQKDAPIFDWSLYLQELLGKDYPENLVNSNPSYLKDLAGVLDGSSVETIKYYMSWQMMKTLLTYGDSTARQLDNDFQKISSGSVGEKPRWKICVDVVNSLMGFTLGRLYVKKHFTIAQKSAAQQMIKNIRKELNRQIKSTKWLDFETRRRALIKEHYLTFKIGYPDEIDDDNGIYYTRYAEYSVDRFNLMSNIVEGLKIGVKHTWSLLKVTDEGSEWKTYPQIVNAYYSPADNEVVLPAGILVSPLFRGEDVPPYLNYASMGSIVSHEVSHAFDNQGRQFDEHGIRWNWWSDTSEQNFRSKSKCFSDQYSNYTTDKGSLSGELTLDENIADNAGIKIAYNTWKSNQIGQKLIGLDHYSAEQLFFISFAQVWCSRISPTELKKRLESDVHSPSRFRVLGSIANMPDFYEAFKCKVPEYKKYCGIW